MNHAQWNRIREAMALAKDCLYSIDGPDVDGKAAKKLRRAVDILEVVIKDMEEKVGRG